MIDYESLIQQATSSFNLKGQKGQLLLNSKSKKDKILINLDLALSKLADDSMRYRMYKEELSQIDATSYNKRLLKDYLTVMNLYILFADCNNWLDIIILSSNEQNRISKLKADSDFNKIYLSIKKMLLNSYYNHDKKDFNFSWKMFNKFGIVDIVIDVEKINDNFGQLNNFD